MKKLLLSTAIVGAVAFAPASQAADLQVNVGGFLDFQAGYVSDDIVGEENSGVAAQNDANEINFNNDTEVSVSVTGKADNGLEYGAVIELEADIANSDDSADNGGNADKTYLFAQGGWGRVELGGNTGAEEALSVNTSTFASATGGVDGDFYHYSATPASPTTRFLTAPDLALADAGNGSAISTFTGNEDATKVTYYSPRVSGFQAGISYIPNTDSVGTNYPQEVGYENIFTGGVNYAGDFSGVGVKAAVTAIRGGDSEKDSVQTQDLEGWDVGANLTYAGFTLGGSYGDWGDTLGVAVDADYYDIGLGYESGPYSASVTYLSSEVNSAGSKDEFDNLVIGADYALAPGLVPYAEVSFFEYNDATGTGVANDNDGTVFIVGSQLTF